MFKEMDLLAFINISQGRSIIEINQTQYFTGNKILALKSRVNLMTQLLFPSIHSIGSSCHNAQAFQHSKQVSNKCLACHFEHTSR